MIKELADIGKAIIFMTLLISFGITITYIYIYLINDVTEGYGEKNQLYGSRYLAMLIH